MVVYLGKATPASGSGGSGGEAVWGEITGTLADQTDLADALGAKQDTLTAGTGIDITDDTISVDGVETNEIDTETTNELGIDNVPTQDSTNLITSGGVYSVLGDIETLLAAI